MNGLIFDVQNEATSDTRRLPPPVTIPWYSVAQERVQVEVLGMEMEEDNGVVAAI
ncbi:hypothetical protein GBA52_010122 [Prunus armeniaca]|nr:hypothetical protein GBA52_010122 [Prunus armeniaca]